MILKKKSTKIAKAKAQAKERRKQNKILANEQKREAIEAKKLRKIELKSLPKSERRRQKKLEKERKAELARLKKLDQKNDAILKKRVKAFHDTTEWIDIEGVADDLVVLSDKLAVFGIKIIPPEVFSLDERGKSSWVSQLNTVYNNCDLEIYHLPIDSPIFVDNYVNNLRSRFYDMNGNPVPDNIRVILENEIDNYEYLSRTNPRKEFCLMVKGNPGDQRFLKKVNDLVRYLRIGGFDVMKLNKVDFENIFAYVFENDMINEFYFSYNTFAMLGDYVSPYDPEDMFPIENEDEPTSSFASVNEVETRILITRLQNDKERYKSIMDEYKEKYESSSKIGMTEDAVHFFALLNEYKGRLESTQNILNELIENERSAEDGAI